MKQIKIFAFLLTLLTGNAFPLFSQILVEAESFEQKGGWVVDQQFMDIMGSPYLMAHGWGNIVADAKTRIVFPETGKYKIFVRTFNWTAPWHGGEGPGKFRLLIDGKPISVVLGTVGNKWLWQVAGTVTIKNKDTELVLHDLTGFNGRCDAIFFTKDLSFVPPVSGNELREFRKIHLNIGLPKEGGDYDLVVAGAGAAGICAAVSAARLGLKVALINNRPNYANRKITWVAFIGGKRESRRLMGDHILNQNDIQNQIKYTDASFTTTWSLDLHYPDPKNSKYFPGEEFFSYCDQPEIIPYHVPYRCLYSRNIENLFMAGRNISVTHVAFGTIRVQRTTAMMGEVVGMAASICKSHNANPREVYLNYLEELKNLMKAGIPKSEF